MKKYQVIFEQTEHFKVELKAKNKKIAENKASEMFSNDEYDEYGDCKVEITNIKEITKN